MVYSSDEINGFGSGIPHMCAVLDGVDEDRFAGLKAIGYGSGIDKFLTEVVQGVNGPTRRAFLIGSDPYALKGAAEKAVENAYASSFYIINPREQEKTLERMKDYDIV